MMKSDSFSPPSNDPFGEGPAAAKARRKRSLGIALALVAFVVIVFIVSIIKLAGGHGF
jgi:hypothetical protein